MTGWLRGLTENTRRGGGRGDLVCSMSLRYYICGALMFIFVIWAGKCKVSQQELEDHWRLLGVELCPQENMMLKSQSQHFKMWPYLEIGPLPVYSEMRSYWNRMGPSLIQYDWCPYNKNKRHRRKMAVGGHTQTWGEGHANEDEGREQSDEPISQGTPRTVGKDWKPGCGKGQSLCEVPKRNQPSWHHDLELPSLQNDEAIIFCFKPSSLQYFVMAALTK